MKQWDQQSGWEDGRDGGVIERVLWRFTARGIDHVGVFGMLEGWNGV